MSTPLPLLTVSHLKYSYDSRIAVAGISFSVEQGEILGFLGPNGAGKTTTLACICGLLSNWQGELTFRNQPFRPSHSLSDRKKLGVVPQELAIYEELSATENLRFFGELQGVSQSQLPTEIERSLKLAGLCDRAKEPVSRFSGGMKRRLNLAIGQLHRPELLLLDEPTVGVDPQSRNHLFDTLLALKSAGHTMIYTTHYMEEAQKLCNRIAIINEGTIVALGTTTELAQHINQPGADLETVFLHLTGRRLRDND